jgi:hypothetical protein
MTAIKFYLGEVVGKPLRLHIAGDVRNEMDAMALGDAAEEWVAAGGGVVFGYTHRWREIPRGFWGHIAIMASCETIEDVKAARDAGYMAELTVLDATASKAALAAEGIKAVRCPAEKKPGMTCRECMKCWRAAEPVGAPVVMLTAHGSAVGIRKVTKTLEGIAA